MNNIYIRILIIFNLMTMPIYSQERIETEFYNFAIPKNTVIKAFDSTHEEVANIDVYQFNFEEKPKYILYLMSNKTNQIVDSITIDNYKDFLFDLGDMKILGIENSKNKIKIDFSYNDKKNIKGIIYMSVTNDILNRFVFLLPNDSAKIAFEEEINIIVNNIKELRNSW